MFKSNFRFAKNFNKTFFAAAAVLLLVCSVFLTSVNAAPINFPAYAFITVAPNPSGVGQPVAVMFWLGDAPPTASGPLGDRWQGYMVKITRPDGTLENKGPYSSDDVGGAYFSYTPTLTGTYTFEMSFPGQWINTTGNNGYQRYYQPANSRAVSLTVQQEAVTGTVDTTLPSGYWTRPINAENREWYRISGNWLMAKLNVDAVAYEGSGSWNKYTTGPETAHIVWTEALTFGGIIGGEYGYGMSYYTGLQYEPLMTPPIIINGVFFHNVANPPRYGFEAVDLRTGEILWYQNSSNQLSFGQVLEYDSPNQHGGLPYLWSVVGSTWHMYDAFTGNYILSISGVPSGLKAMGQKGEVLVYTLSTSAHTLSLWNSTKAINPTTDATWMWRPDTYRGQTLNGTLGIEWTVTGNTAPSGSSFQWFWADGQILVSHARVSVPNQAWPTLVHTGFDAKTGVQLWTQNRTDMGALTYPVYITPNEGVYALYVRERKQWVGWDMQTGAQLWTTDPISDDWGYYEVTGGFAYGNFYSAGYDGAIHTYNARTGVHLWDYYIGSSRGDTPYGSWPLFGATVFGDNKIYIATNEHSPSTPLWHGERLYCVDAITGQGVWNVSGMYAGGRNGLGALADGYFVTANGYDNRIYSFGKGLTTTTVSVSPKISVQGSSILVEGTVTDQSSGAKGTPAISDADMTEWMEYLYMQQPKPADVTGVQVKLTAIDVNGDVHDIGTVTTGSSGLFSAIWTPTVEGTYTVTASFVGSKGYYESSAEAAVGITAAVVSPAPTETAAPTSVPTDAPTSTPATTVSPSPAPNPDAGLTTETILIVGAAVAIIAVGAVVAVVLRRRTK